MILSRSHFYILGACLAFALMPLCTRQAQADFLSLAAWRAVVVALGFAGASLAEGGGLKSLRLSPEAWKLSLVYGLALGAASSTFVGGYALTTVANAVFLHSLAPLAVFPLAFWAFREKPSPAALTGAILAVLGVGLLSGVSLFNVSRYSDPRFLLGDGLALFSALAYGAVLVTTRAARNRSLPILPVLAVSWGVAALLLLPIAATFGTLALPTAAIPWVLLLGFLCTNVPFYLLNLGMRDLPAGTASLLGMAEVVFATALGWMAYGEEVAPIGWVGAGLVFMGILQPLWEGSSPADSAGEEAMDPQFMRIRGLRLALRLILLNVAALLAVLGGEGEAALLAWIALPGLLRLGLRPAQTWLGGRHAVLLQVAAASGAVAAGVAMLREGQAGDSLLVAGVALGAWGADRFLMNREVGGSREGDDWAQAALLLLATGLVLSRALHPGGPLLLVGMRGALLLSSLLLLGGVLFGGGSGRSPLKSLETLPGWMRQPRFLGASAVILSVVGCFSVVPPGHRAVVERWGYPLPEMFRPGWLMRFPPPMERVTLVDVGRTQRMPVSTPEVPLLCGDQSLVSMAVMAHVRVGNPLAYALRSSDAEATLQALTRAALVEVVASQPLDAVLTTGRAKIQTQVRQLAQAAADSASLGLVLDEVHVEEVGVPAPVLSSFLDVISAEEEKRTLINQADAYAAQVVPRARGEALARRAHAEGEGTLSRVRATAETTVELASLRGSGGASGLARHRRWLARWEEVLRGKKLFIVSPSLHLWMGDRPPSFPPRPSVPKGGEKTSPKEGSRG